jgi:soluble lytic murein transglycosylase
MSRLWFALLVLVVASAHGAAPDDEFLAAREAYRTGNTARLDKQAARLKGHLLEPYVLYWQLSRRLEQASITDVRAFLEENRDSPLSERLRNEWLKSLGRSGEWEFFNAELPLLVGDDLEITCYSLQARLRVNAAETLPEARPLWFIARDLPESCTPLFEALVAAGMLSHDDLWTRLRLALEVGQVSLARSIAKWLPAGARAARARIHRVEPRGLP